MRSVGRCDVQPLATVLVVAALSFALPSGGCVPPQYGPEAAARRQRARQTAARERAKQLRERRDNEPHPVMAAYRAAVEPHLSEEEREAFEAVSLYDTQEGDNERLRYMTADHVVRVLLPAALLAHDDPVLALHAQRLRALPPLLNRDIDMVALPIVRDAMHALHVFEASGGRHVPAPPGARSADGLDAGAAGEVANGPPEAVPGSAVDDRDRDSAAVDASSDPEDGNDEESLEVASEDATDPLAEAMMAEALAEYAEAYATRHGVSAREADAAAAAAADAISAGSMVRYVIEHHGVPRDVAVGGALQLYQNMADAARRRERVPRPPPLPMPATSPPDPVTP